MSEANKDCAGSPAQPVVQTRAESVGPDNAERSDDVPLDCKRRHTFDVCDFADGEKITCKRCGKKFTSIRLERVGDSLRIANPKKLTQRVERNHTRPVV
jgi:hypothetical protein